MTSPGELTEDASEIAALLGRVNGLEAQAVLDRADIENLRIGLDSARRIGAGIGVVMSTLKVTEDEAFQVLRNASQNMNRKLRNVAADAVHTGLVPPPALPRPLTA